MMEINFLEDGQELPSVYRNVLLRIIEDENQIIIKAGVKIKINFVGYLEISFEEKTYRFFSFPKFYQITNELIDMKKIITTIEASFKNAKIDHTNFYISQFKAIKEIIDYYYEYGLYQKKEEVNVKKTTGKINFKKTIKKITPTYSNNNYIYDKFLVKKKQTSNTLLTDCMAYIIETGTKKYNFYFNPIQTNYAYDKSIFKNIKLLLNQLLKLRIDVFKDEEKKLIDNIIAYFKNSSLSNVCKSSICTTDYKFVYETMVHSALCNMTNAQYEKQTFYMSETDNNNRFTPDHLDIKNKVIADSKYYVEEASSDYKQLFYLQHIGNQYASSSYYIQRVMEMNKWVNVLILPHTEYEPKQIIKRKTIDGLNLFTLKISINDLIDFQCQQNDLIIGELEIAITKMREENLEN